MSTGDPVGREVTDRIFDAALKELADRGIDRVTIDRIAAQVGVDPGELRAEWHDWRVLLMDALLTRSEQVCPCPNTGSPDTDLEALAASLTRIADSPAGRRLFRRVLPGGRDMDVSRVKDDFWDTRLRALEPLLERAADRGYLRDGVNPREAINMFGSAFYFDVIFNDTPVRPEYAEQVLDIFLHGIAEREGAQRPWTDLSRSEEEPETDRRLKAARHAIALLQAWADALPDSLILVEAVRDGAGGVVDFIYRDLNAAACEEFGLPRSQLLGRSVLEHQSDIESSGLAVRFAECLESGEPLFLDDFTSTQFYEARRVDIRAARAGFELLTVSWRDVTTRLESTNTLAESERWLRLMTENSADVIVHIRDAIITWASPSTEAWYWVGQPVIDLVPPEDHMAAIEALMRIDEGKKVVFRVHLKGPDGSMHWSEAHCKIFYDEQGNQDGYIASFRVIDHEMAPERTH